MQEPNAYGRLIACDTLYRAGIRQMADVGNAFVYAGCLREVVRVARVVTILISFISAASLYMRHVVVPTVCLQPFLLGGSSPIQSVLLIVAMRFTFIVFEGY